MNRAASNPENQRKAKRKATQVVEPEPTNRVLIVDPKESPSQGDKADPNAPPKDPAAEEAPAVEEKPSAKEPSDEAAKKGETTKPGAEIKAENPEFKRSQLRSEEAMVRKFQEPLDTFDPLKTLDYKDDSFLELYEMVADDDLDLPAGRANASNYSYAAEIIYQYYRFLRTNEKSPEKIEAYYKQRKEELKSHFGRESLSEANYRNVMPFPREEQGTKRPSYQEYRGHLYHFTGLLMQKYQIRVWEDEDNNSGIRDTWLLVCRDLKRRDELYGVLVPHSARHLLSRDEVDNADIVAWKGLFLQRWTFENKDGNWSRMPIYVAWNVDRLAQPPSAQGTNWLLVVIGGLLCIGLIFVFWQTSKDSKQVDSLRRNYGRRLKGVDKASPASAQAGSTPEPKPPTDAPPSPAADQAVPSASPTEPPPAAAPASDPAPTPAVTPDPPASPTPSAPPQD
jgi:outer membrane biosynthesis protein TonB